GEKDPNVVNWKRNGELVVNALMKYTGRSFNGVVGENGRRLDLEKVGQGSRRLSVRKYSALLRELRELPPYGLLQALTSGIDILQRSSEGIIPLEYISINSRLTEQELQIVKEGYQTYGGSFMRHIFPVYISMKQKYGFPAQYFDWITNYPNNPVVSRSHRPPRDAMYNVPRSITAEILGTELNGYKTLLDRNNGHKMIVTEVAILQMIKGADIKIMGYAALHR
ncbi:MAG: hypothetical protein AABX34_00195, partial [Nanoarchaeota archaeon]